MKTNIYFLSYLAHFFLEREIFQTKYVEKVKTHFVFGHLFFFFLENRAVYEVIRKNTVD